MSEQQPMPQWERELLAILFTVPNAAEVSAIVARQYHRGVLQDCYSRHIRYFLEGHHKLAWYFFGESEKHYWEAKNSE